MPRGPVPAFWLAVSLCFYVAGNVTRGDTLIEFVQAERVAWERTMPGDWLDLSGPENLMNRLAGDRDDLRRQLLDWEDEVGVYVAGSERIVELRLRREALMRVFSSLSLRARLEVGEINPWLVIPPSR